MEKHARINGTVNLFSTFQVASRLQTKIKRSKDTHVEKAGDWDEPIRNVELRAAELNFR